MSGNLRSCFRSSCLQLAEARLLLRGRGLCDGPESRDSPKAAAGLLAGALPWRPTLSNRSLSLRALNPYLAPQHQPVVSWTWYLPPLTGVRLRVKQVLCEVRSSKFGSQRLVAFSRLCALSAALLTVQNTQLRAEQPAVCNAFYTCLAGVLGAKA